MKKTSQILLVLILSTFSTIISSQVNDASIVIGLESNYIFSSTTKTKPLLGSVSGLTVQKPMGQYSVGIGFLSKSFNGLHSYTEPTGITKIYDGEVLYEFDKIFIEPEYYSFATRVYYRLPCNCLYLFGGFEVDYLRKNEVKIIKAKDGFAGSDFSNREIREVSVREKVYNFNIGAGFNFPISQRLRFFGRPSIVVSQKIYPNVAPTYKHYKEQPVFAHLSFGMEYGFGTYN